MGDDQHRQQQQQQELPAPTTYDRFLKRHQNTNEKQSRLALNPEGESGRRGFHPGHFFRINFRSTSRASTLCNILWPFVPAALAVRYTMEERHILIFTLAYIAMVPCANLIGFAGQELAQKLPRVIGMLTEITLGSVVEIVLFIVLLSKDYFSVIKAAILGSILATMLLCLGFCFFVGGVGRTEQTFGGTISENGHGLLFLAGVSLAVPTVFGQGIFEANLSNVELDDRTLQISRIISVLLIIAYAAYLFFTVTTHHGLYDAQFAYDEHRDADKHEDAQKAKLTMTECIISLLIAIPLVAIIAITLVLQIEHVIEVSNVSDAFMGLILVPLVEKFAEHLTAIDEAFDNQMNLALSHVLGATIQTTLFNAPLTVVVAWGLGKQMDLNFDIFNLVMLILSILTVGRFLQDGKSNYLEGLLLVLLYIAVAVSAWYYPNPTEGH
ncbi:Sodium/calcium exchanger protein-domain-containing protein [Emericellopsis atlantica]|uniref:Vacuolar calcium ion transporter n=1 Tax=Emericellopsis atlantica TaxID=2614577 RepID=A0A9P8CSG7_9HYPO|nr:Sodium/calcium exchanger protein-domain-containing protein [Emericellopsis atlantica]KAG9257337.1 Sodium/calcium exchanger protein-domain-containing protein [Emericellopsis atlantica]